MTETESYSALACWEPRTATPADSAARTGRLLTALAHEDRQAFSIWYETGMSKDEALSKPIDLDHPPEMLLAGAKRRMDPKSPIDAKMAMMATLWNGQDGPLGAQLMVTSGDVGLLPNRPFPNSVSLDIPTDPAWRARNLNLPYLKSLIVEMADVWDARFGSIFSSGFRPIWKRVPQVREVGWLCYARGVEPSQLPRLPDTVDAEPVGPGCIISGMRRSFSTPPSESDLARVQAVVQCLADAGVLPRR